MSRLNPWFRGGLAALALTAAASPAWAGCNLPANLSLRPGDSYSHNQSNGINGLPNALHYVFFLHSGAPLSNLVVRANPGNPSPNFFTGTQANVLVSFQVPSNAAPGTATITLVAQNASHQTECSDQMTVTILPPHCQPKAFWLNANPTSPLDGTLISAGWDGANCFVRAVPPNDGTAFVYDNKFYVSLGKNWVCEAGYWDGANCYLGAAPAGTAGFVYFGNFYYAE